MTTKPHIGSILLCSLLLVGCSSGNKSANPPAVAAGNVTKASAQADFSRLRMFNASSVDNLTLSVAFHDASAETQPLFDQVKDFVLSKITFFHLNKFTYADYFRQPKCDPATDTGCKPSPNNQTKYLIRDSTPTPLRVTTTDVLYDHPIELPLKKDYLLVALGGVSTSPASSSFDILFVPTEKDPVRPLRIDPLHVGTTTLFRIVNASPSSKEVDLYILTPDQDIETTKPFLEKLQFKQFTYYFPFPAGLYRVLITPHGKKTPLAFSYKAHTAQEGEPSAANTSATLVDYTPQISTAQNAILFEGRRLITCVLSGEEGKSPLQINILPDTLPNPTQN